MRWLLPSISIVVVLCSCIACSRKQNDPVAPAAQEAIRDAQTFPFSPTAIFGTYTQQGTPIQGNYHDVAIGGIVAGITAYGGAVGTPMSVAGYGTAMVTPPM